MMSGIISKSYCNKSISVTFNLMVDTTRQATKVLLQVGQDIETIGCSSLSAAVSADEQSRAKVLIFNF